MHRYDVALWLTLFSSGGRWFTLTPGERRELQEIFQIFQITKQYSIIFLIKSFSFCKSNPLLLGDNNITIRYSYR